MSCPMHGALGCLIWGGRARVCMRRSVDPCRGRLQLWESYLSDYKEYPVILGATGGGPPGPRVLDLLAKHRGSSGILIRSPAVFGGADKVAGPTCKVGGYSGRSGPLVRGPWDPGQWGPMGTHVSQAPDRRVGIAAEARSCRRAVEARHCRGREGCTGIKKKRNPSDARSKLNVELLGRRTIRSK